MAFERVATALPIDLIGRKGLDPDRGATAPSCWPYLINLVAERGSESQLPHWAACHW